MGEAVKVFGVDYSPYSLRVELALKLKGVDYEFIEEDLFNKSEDLLKYNPIYKKVPVFIHNGKHLAESLVIMEYIDETWNIGYPLLPSDPYQRAHARFWANFIDVKIMTAIRTIIRSKEEEREKLREEVTELIKILENEVKGKKYLIGNEIGYLDLVAIVVALWATVLLEAIDEDIVTREKFPEFWTWVDHLLSCEIVKAKIPIREKLIAFYRERIPILRAINYGQNPK